MTQETFRNNVELLKQLQPDYIDRKIMFAGRYDPATGNADPNVYTALDEGFVWVRDRDSRVAVPALMSVLTAMCSVQFGDRLRTGINEEGDREAISPYIIRQNVNKLNQVLYESKKSNLTPIEGLEGGVVRASSTPGLSVYVGPNTALGWLGGDIAVDSADEPANPNEIRFLVFYFTGVYGAAPTYATTTAHISTGADAFATTYLAEAYAEPLPNKAVRLWAVTYAEGQTSITYSTSRFVHLRSAFNPDWLVTADTSAASDGDVPTWDATAGEWVVAAPTGGATTGGERILTVEGVLSVNTNPLRIYNTSATTRTITKVFASVAVAPTGASVIVDILKNGTTIFTTSSNRPEIAISGFTDDSTAIDDPDWDAGDYFQLRVAQIGSTIPGSYLTVQVVYS